MKFNRNTGWAPQKKSNRVSPCWVWRSGSDLAAKREERVLALCGRFVGELKGSKSTNSVVRSWVAERFRSLGSCVIGVMPWTSSWNSSLTKYHYGVVVNGDLEDQPVTGISCGMMAVTDRVRKLKAPLELRPYRKHRSDMGFNALLEWQMVKDWLREKRVQSPSISSSWLPWETSAQSSLGCGPLLDADLRKE